MYCNILLTVTHTRTSPVIRLMEDMVAVFLKGLTLEAEDLVTQERVLSLLDHGQVPTQLLDCRRRSWSRK